MTQVALKMEPWAMIVIPDNVPTFNISTHCMGTEIVATQMFRAPMDPVVICHTRGSVQLLAKNPIDQAIRVVIVDYREIPRYRTIMGCIWFGGVPGDIRVSDYRMSIGASLFPDIMKKDTVYIMGVRFPAGANQTITLQVMMRDEENRIDFREKIELVHIGAEKQFIRSNVAISTRAKMQNRPDPTRYIPIDMGDTRGQLENVPQKASKERKSSTSVPRAEIPSTSPSTRVVNSRGGAIPKTPKATTNTPRDLKSATHTYCEPCDWMMPNDKFAPHQRIYHTPTHKCPICYKMVPIKDVDGHLDSHVVPVSHCRVCDVTLPDSEMERHMETHEQHMVQCGTCDIMIERELAVEHMATHVSPMVLCDICDIRIKDELLPKHMETHVHAPRSPTMTLRRKTFQCPLCTKVVEKRHATEHAIEHACDKIKPSVVKPKNTPRTKITIPKDQNETKQKERKLTAEHTPVYPKVIDWQNIPKFEAAEFWGQKKLDDATNKLNDLKVQSDMKPSSDYGNSSPDRRFNRQRRRHFDASNEDSIDQGNSDEE